MINVRGEGMSKIDLNQLNDIQYDVLREIGNIGAGNATTALSQMLNQKMDMSVPKVALVPLMKYQMLWGLRIRLLLVLC